MWRLPYTFLSVKLRICTKHAFTSIFTSTQTNGKLKFFGGGAGYLVMDVGGKSCLEVQLVLLL